MRILASALALAVLGAFAPPGSASVINPAGGSELSLEGPGGIVERISQLTSTAFLRVDDALDQKWFDHGGGTVAARARFAGYDSDFGFLTTDGFVTLLSAPNRQGVVEAPEFVALGLAFEEPFAPAIRTPAGQIWSAVVADNGDSADHMVTFVDAADPYHYLIAFEDLGFPGSDGDFNDFVLELFDVRDAPIPAPATVALFGLGLAGLGLGRRRHAGPGKASRSQVTSS